MMRLAQHNLSAIAGICRQLEPRQPCFNIIQALCRMRVPVTVIWFRLAVERYAVDVARRKALVCGINSAVAISRVTNEGSDLERH
jgi:hypothetical protein